jgi:SAM-dependent methyltransferase
MKDATPAATHDREEHFHNEWARGTDVETLPVRELFEAPVALENQFILRQMGPLAGKSVLDIGSGLGESSVYFALQGANVTMVDLSPEMVACGQRLAARFGVHVEGIVAAAEDLRAGRDRFDIVYAANILHHVTDRDAFFASMRDALVVGGKFFSCDPLRYNPAINVYRRIATGVRTSDERPLGFEDLDVARRHFATVRHREFWIAALALFGKYYLVDHVDPNSDRYWKRIFRETPRTLRWWTPLCGLDQVLTRLPLVQRLAWNMVMWGQKTG